MSAIRRSLAARDRFPAERQSRACRRRECRHGERLRHDDPRGGHPHQVGQAQQPRHRASGWQARKRFVGRRRHRAGDRHGETPPDAIAALVTDARGRLATDRGWKDTPGESVRIVLHFALPFAGPQAYLLHCHNLEHEDAGTMLGVKVA